MKLHIQSTDIITDMDGVPVRLWEGKTESGIPCKVFVHRLAVSNAYDSSQFDGELKEQLPPVRKVSLREIM